MNVVVGGGLLGSALTRALAAAGEPVRVLSRTPRDLPGLWTRFELAGARWPTLPPDARVFVAVAPRPGEPPPWSALAQALPSLRAGPVLLIGPAGDPGLDLAAPFAATVLRVPLLFGAGAAWLSGPLQALRERGVVRVPRGLPPVWPLHADDAARAAIALHGHAGRVLKGPERLELDALAATLCGRAGARRGRPLWPWTARGAEVLAAQDRLPDGWSDDLGARQRLSPWIEAELRAHS